MDTIHGMIPLHMLSMNPNAKIDAIALLSNVKIDSAFCKDNNNNTPLDYTRHHNFDALVTMIAILCTQKRKSTGIQITTTK